MGDQIIGGLAYILKANSAQFEAGFARARGVANQFHNAMGGVSAQLRIMSRGLVAAAGVAGLGTFVRSSFASVDALAKMSRRLNVSTTDLGKLQFVGQQSGITIEATNKIIQDFEKRLGETARGIGEARLGFKALGVDVAALGRQSPVDAFRAVVASLAKVENAFDQTAIAQRIFGEQGAAILQATENLTSNYGALAAQAQAAGRAIESDLAARVEAANDAMNLMRHAVRTAGDQLAVALAPAVESFATSMTALVNSTRGFVDFMNRATGGLAGLAVRVSAGATTIAALGAGLAYAGKRTIELTAAVGASAAKWFTNSAAVEGNTAALIQNAAAAKTAAVTTAGLSGAQAARLFELRRGAVLRSAERARIGEAFRGQPIGLAGAASAATFRIPAAQVERLQISASRVGSAFERAGAAAAAFGGTVRAALSTLAVPGAILALVQAAKNFHTWATKGAEAAGIWGDTLLGFWHRITGNNAMQQLNRDWEKHNRNVEEYVRKQQEAAAAADRTRGKLEQQAEAVRAANAPFVGLAESLSGRLREHFGETERQRVTREFLASVPIPTFDTGADHLAVIQRGLAEIDRVFGFLERDQPFSARNMEGFRDAVQAARAEVENFGKTQEEMVLARMREALQTAVELGDTARQLELGKLIRDYETAIDKSRTLTRETSRQREQFDAVVGAFRRQQELRDRADRVASDFRPGFVQRGSAAEFQQARQIEDANRTLVALQRQEVRLNQQIVDAVRAGNLNTREIAEAVARDRASLP